MVRTSLLAVAALLGLQARAAELPRVAVVPFVAGDGVTEKQAARLSAMVSDELKGREDDVEWVGEPAAKPAPPPPAPAKSAPTKPSAESVQALAEGKKLLADLKFEDATSRLKAGIDGMLQDPGTADISAVLDAHVSLAVAYLRLGQEKDAGAALFAVARLEPRYKLQGSYPPVFVHEFEKAKKRADKQPKATLSLDGPPGATAFIDGRDLGMVPVDESVPVGAHYVRLEGTKGERWGLAVDLKPSGAKVKGSFDARPVKEPVAEAPKAPALPETRIGATLDADTGARVAHYLKAVGADFAVVGVLSRINDTQLGIATALYSARRQGFVALPLRTLEPEMLSANVEVFKVVDEAVKKVKAFGNPSPYPVALLSAKAVKVAAAAPPEVGGESPRKALKAKPLPEDVPRKSDGERPGVRAFTEKSTVVSDERPLDPVAPPPTVTGKRAVWPWVLVGVGVLAAGAGGYYGYTQATKPVTGTVTASWGQ